VISLSKPKVRLVEFALVEPDVVQTRLREHDASHSTVPQLYPLEQRLVQERSRQLAVNRENIDERETSKLRTRQHGPVQLATREADPIRNLPGQVGIEDALIFPVVV
jgi:hypothetical protein